MFYFVLSWIFIVLTLINMVFLYSREKFRKLSIIFFCISLIFAVFSIISINISYNWQIEKEFKDYEDQKVYYIGWVKGLNLNYIIVSLVMTASFFILSFILKVCDVRYIILYDLIIGVQLIMHVYLFFFECILITKNNIDMSMLSASLMWYYLNFAFIPLVCAKYIKNK